MNTYPQTDSELTERIWRLMQWHTGKERRIQRGDLTRRIYGRVTTSLDRKVRDALAELPIVWDGGYFIPETKQEAEDYIASMRSRQASIGQRLRIVENYLRQQGEPERVEQMRLMEV